MKKNAFIMIAIACVMWGTSGLFSHYLTPFGYTSAQMTSVRGTVSFLCVLVFALIRDRGLFRVKFRDLILCVFIGASLFLTSFCYFSAMPLTGVSTAVVLMYAAPIYVTLFSVCFLGERMTALKFVSVAGMLAGCVLVSGIIGGGEFGVAGIFLAFGSGLAYASYNILTKIAMRRGIKPGSLTLYGFFSMSVISLAVSNPIQTVRITAEDPFPLIPALLLLGVVTFVVPYFIYTVSLGALSAGTASSLGILEPMSATVFSVLLLHEELTALSVVGIVLIIASVLLLSRVDE